MARKAKDTQDWSAIDARLREVAMAASGCDFSRLVELLDDDSGAVARASAVALSGAGQAAAADLIRGLRSRTRGSLLAERCLKDSGPSVAAALLDELALGGDPCVRAAVLNALCATCGADGFPGLLDLAIDSGDFLAAAAAAASIHRLADDLAVPLLARALTEPAQESLSIAAAQALAARGPDGEEVLFDAFAYARDRTAAIAAAAMRKTSAKAKAPEARAGRAASLVSHDGLGSAARFVMAGRHEGAVELLRGLLQSDDRECAVAAVGLLAECGEAAVPALVLAIRSDDALREASAISLFEIGCNESFEAMGFLVRDEYRPSRWATACALGLNGHEIAIEPLAEALREGDTRWKVSAVNALSGIRCTLARDCLVDALEDPEYRVRRVARAALATSWPGTPSLSPAEALSFASTSPRRVNVLREADDLLGELKELLASEDPDERTLAARSLGAIGASEASDALAEAMLDADDRVAIEARIALMRLDV